VSSCSSSDKDEVELDAAPADEIASAEATTDPVPAEGADGLPPASEAPPAAALGDELAPTDPTATAAASPDMTDPTAAPVPGPETAAAPEPANPIDTPSASIDAPTPVTTASTRRSSEASVDTSGWDNYTVQAGDTLMKIAFETYGDLYRWREIYDGNREKISNPNSIPAGTVIKVEKPAGGVNVARNGEKYLIKDGDTLGTISHDVYGTKAKWKKLWENNRELIKDPNRIFAGFYLYYTVDEEMAPRPLAQGQPAVDPNRMPASAAAPAAPPVEAVQPPPAPVSDSAAPAAAAPAAPVGNGG
jgi:nucleoid-associated protein YgaU